MTTEQLLKQVYINRDLITRKNDDAYEHLETLQSEYAHLIDEEIAISIELNKSLLLLIFKADYAGAIDHSLAMLDKYKNTTCKAALSFHLKMVGTCYAHMGEFDLAERNLLEALETMDSNAQPFPAGRCDILHALAMTKDFVDPTSTKILDYLTEALHTLRGIDGQDVRRANCQMGIGNYYNNIGDINTALVNFKQAAETFEQNYRLASMGNCYSNMGSCYLKMDDIASAEKYLEKALELRMKFGSPDELCISYFNMGVLNRHKEDFLLSEEYLFKALKIAEETGSKRMVARINDKLTEITQVKRQLKAA